MPKTDTSQRKKLPKDLAEPAAYSIWLAGLGALAVAKEEKGDHKLFSRLIERGRDIDALGTIDVGNGIIDLQKVRPHTVGAEVTPPAPSAAEVSHLRRNAQARKAFLAEFGTLTSREVAEHAGSRAANQAALANRWKAEGRVFAVEMGGQTLFPAFQFSDDDGQPRPIIAEILAVLQPKLSGWQTALWFSGRNGWLGAKRPVDVLTSDPGAVAEAARQEAEAFD